MADRSYSNGGVSLQRQMYSQNGASRFCVGDR
jgi:hypothetical protein